MKMNEAPSSLMLFIHTKGYCRMETTAQRYDVTLTRLSCSQVAEMMCLQQLEQTPATTRWYGIDTSKNTNHQYIPHNIPQYHIIPQKYIYITYNHISSHISTYYSHTLNILILHWNPFKPPFGAQSPGPVHLSSKLPGACQWKRVLIEDHHSSLASGTRNG